jgi:hypothetical protein
MEISRVKELAAINEMSGASPEVVSRNTLDALPINTDKKKDKQDKESIRLKRLQTLAGVVGDDQARSTNNLKEELIIFDRSTIGKLARQLVDAAMVDQPDISKAKQITDTAAKEIYKQLLAKIDDEFKMKNIKTITGK